ncbi:MAG: hypothetical protein BIFFINMI_04148 [Phycisphaerae bacterium]|nr:hypothetical protein [Phycisphaerae bacterium]
MRNTTRYLLLPLLGAIGLSACGCQEFGKVRLLVGDELAAPGETVEVVAHLKRTGWSAFFPPSDPPPIVFHRGNEQIDRVQPKDTNSVSTHFTPDGVGDTVIDVIYQPRPATQPLSGVCHVACWDSSKVAIAIDLDAVLNHATRFDRMTLEFPLGEARPDAAEVLGTLAKHFRLVYLTEMGLEARNAIRAWLSRNRLPDAPIFTWQRGSSWNLLARGDQASTLRDLRAKVPALLIGLGSGVDDLSAFQANGMLAVMVNFEGGWTTPPDVPAARTWQEVWQFFTYDGNFPILSDPKAMLDLHDRNGDYVKFNWPGQ